VEILLRIAAVYSLAWAVGLAFPSWIPVDLGRLGPEMRSLANGLASANLVLAYLFNRAAADPPGHRGILYTALALFGLRAVLGTYEVLYLLDGPAAVVRLTDMVLSLALFVGLLNSLPATLQRRRTQSPAGSA
jgi:heme A synthase